jgi:hypothetical protein
MPARHSSRRGKDCKPHHHHRGRARSTVRPLLLLLPLLLKPLLLKPLLLKPLLLCFSAPRLLLQLRLLLRILLFLRVPALLHLLLLLVLLLLWRVRHNRFH